MQKKYDVVIVGAGSGGLALALLLVRAGLRVALLNRGPGITPMMRPEIIQPRLLAILNDLGPLSDTLAFPHHRCTTFNFYTAGEAGKEGRHLCQVDYGILNHPFPYALITLPHLLQEALWKQLELHEQASLYGMADVRDRLRTGDQIIGCRAEVNGQPIDFLAPVIVGADGPHSKIRQLLGLPCQLHRYENPFFSFPLPKTSEAVEYFMGRKKILGLFPISSNTGCALYLATSSEIKNRGEAAFSLFRDSVAEIDPAGAALSLDGIRSWKDVTVLPCSRVRADRWVADGACLMGDAAHATHPHVAQGTTQAFEDALVLAETLKDCFAVGDFSSQRLMAYQAVRKPVVTRLQRLADEYVWLWDTGNRLLAALRNRAFTNVGKSKRLLYKTIASEAGLHAEGLTLLDRLRAVIGI